MTEPTRDRLLRLLSAETSPLRDEGVTLAIDHILGRPLTELVDFETGASIVVRALTAETAERIVSRHVKPGFDRYAAEAARSSEVVGALVPDPARDKIRSIVKASRLPRAAWAAGLVEPALLRKLFGPVWVQLLLSFGSKLPLPGMGAASAVGRGMGGMSGIAGRLSRSAEKLADAGRSVMGGLGAEVEKRIQAAARDFSDSAADIFKDALSDRLASPEGAELVEQIAGQVIDHVMTTRLTDIQKDVESIDVDGIFGVVPDIVGHAAPHAFIRRLVKGEVEAYVALEGHRTLTAVLSEMGVLADVRAVAVQRSSAIARGFFGTPEFGEFLGRLLDS